MAAANCTPISYPRLPPTHQHPMWQAWDMAAEMCLLQLPALLADPSAEFTPSSFFSEQLTAFELWLAHGSADKRPPEQLPIVLQVLLSQVHRLRALVLLGRFLDMGSWAVDLALSVGIFPYVLKLLQTTSNDLRTTLVFIWAKILALDKSCQADLVKDSGHLYFLKYMDAPEASIDHHSRAQAVFVLAVVCDGHPKGQALCAAANLLSSILRWLRVLLPVLGSMGGSALLAKWLCLCLGKLADDMPDVCAAAIRDGAPDLLSGLLGAQSPDLRAAAVYALGSLIYSVPRVEMGASGTASGSGVIPVEQQLAGEQALANILMKGYVVYDASPLVRAELAVALARFVRGHMPLLQDAVALQQRRVAELMKAYQRHVVKDEANNAAGVAVDVANSSSGSIASSVEGGGAATAAAGGGGGNMKRSISYDVPPSHWREGSNDGSHGRSTGSMVSLIMHLMLWPCRLVFRFQCIRIVSDTHCGGNVCMLHDGLLDSILNPQSLCQYENLALSCVSTQGEPSPSKQWGDGSDGLGMNDGLLGGYQEGAPGGTHNLYSYVLEAVLMLATDPSPKV